MFAIYFYEWVCYPESIRWIDCFDCSLNLQNGNRSWCDMSHGTSPLSVLYLETQMGALHGACRWRWLATDSISDCVHLSAGASAGADVAVRGATSRPLRRRGSLLAHRTPHHSLIQWYHLLFNRDNVVMF